MKDPNANPAYPRATTGLGYLFELLGWLNWPRLTRWLMRSPWHVCDELIDGKWIPIYAYPKTLNPTMEELNRIAERKAAAIQREGYTPKRTKVATIRIKPGMKLWQRIDGKVVEVQIHGNARARTADVDLNASIVAALNASNAERKLNARGR